jgi:RNA 2',3'-cyclic 3'-phosphodiesterase
MRTFVAAEITNEGLLNSIQKLQEDLKINAKPISLKNIHFTLLFLGEVSEQMSKKVQNSLNSIEFSSFNVMFSGVGAFPKPKFPRVVWIGIDKDGEKQLINLAKQVEEKLSLLGFRSDKPFKPHVTIFRIKNRVENISDELTRFRSISLGIQKISEIKFKKSDLTPNGPIYTDLQVVRAKQ